MTTTPSMKSALLMALLLASAAASAEAPTADEVVSTMEKLNGVTPGARRNHIRGICATGSFLGAPALQAYSRSALFSGQPVPVVARFSLAGGNPNTPDSAKSPRGLAIEFRLPGGGLQHFTMLNVPVFSAATPQTFQDALLANLPDPQTGKPDPAKQQAFRDSHPDAKPLAEFMARNNPPVSYAQSEFYSVHTFKFVSPQDQTTLVRWRFEPEAGVSRWSDEALKTAPTRFLDEDLLGRVKAGPLRWNMVVTLGEAGDEQNNPTVYWPSERRQVQAGVLTLTAATPQAGAECEKLNFDPLVIAEGIAPTQDPVLLFRSPAYAASFVKRLTGR
ncbi:catalase family peroxidase [Curvibacter gracilis]|uniref:catalase family peroxidase n=1 Tax=Curvibacter gracilis TaxID=230310 RepID=UPI0004B6F968|nr:catalase family peroxidase [Curvibacter gracilis]